MLSRRSVLLASIFAPMAVHTARTEGLAPADLVLVRQGSLPIILTVPHGGREAIPGVAPRDTLGKPSGGRGFVTVTDTNTERLALGIAAEVKALTGKEPYLVMAKFKRKFVDPTARRRSRSTAQRPGPTTTPITRRCGASSTRRAASIRAGRSSSTCTARRRTRRW
jgi:hypothetical protein